YDRVQCMGCGGRGRVTCSGCAGQRYVICDDCVGSGKVTCTTCDGEAKVVDYIAIKQSFEPRELTNRVTESSCPDEVVERLEVPVDYKPVDGVTARMFTSRPVLHSTSGVLLSQVDRAIDSSKKSLSDSRRIVKQRLWVGRTTIVDVAYQFSGS